VSIVKHPWAVKEVERLAKLLDKGYSIPNASKALGRSFASVHSKMQNLGLHVKPPKDPVAQRVEREEVSRTKKETNELVSEVRRLRELVEVQSKIAAQPLPKIKRVELASGVREATAVAMLSDLHVEERVLKGDTPIGNVYNLSIAETRLGRAFSGVEWLINHHSSDWKIRNLVLWFGGDMMSGQIHEENLETSDGTPIETLLWLYPRLVAGVRQLLSGLDLTSLQLICSYGNHGRDTKKCRFAKGAGHSYEWGMYQRLAHDLADDKRVQVLADPSEHQYTTVYDWDLHFHHGHRINYGGGVGGIMIPINKAVSQWDKVRHCDFHHFGHFHQYFDHGNVTGNGSLIGYNSYAMGIKASPEPPQQAFYLLDSKRAKCCMSPIWVSE
jgi:hypothetical protein